MPGLPPVEQLFTVNAAEFLGGLDEMLGKLDEVAASIDAVVASAAKMGASFDASMASADEALTTAAGAADRAAESARVATESTEALTEAERAAAEAAQFEAELLADLDRSQALLADSAKAVTDGLAAEARSMKVLGDSAVLAGEEVEEAGTRSAAAGDKTAAAGGKAATAGRMWKTAFLGIGLAVVYGVDQAAKFQEQVSRLYTAAGLTGSGMKQVSAQILKVGDATGFTGTQIAEALYHPVSAGLNLKTALAAVTQGAILANIHGANLDDTMYALSSVMKAFNQNAGDAGNTAALLNSIVGQGDMRFQDFNQSVKNWAPTGAAMGISIQSMGAAIAYLTDRGNSAEVASTRLTMGLSMVTAGSKEANTFLSALGLTSGDVALKNKTLADVMNGYGLTTNKIAADLKQPDGIYVALQDLQGAFRHSGLSAEQADQVMAKLFGGGRSDKAILSLMSNLDGLKSKYQDIGKGVSSYASSWQKTQQTVSFQWHQAVADAKNLAISFGSLLLPATDKVLKGLSRVMSVLQQHPVIAAAAGAVLALAAGFKIAATMEGLFDLVTEADPVFLVLTGIIALAVGLYELYTHFKIVRDVVADVGKFFATVWSDAVKAAGAVVNWFVSGPLAFIKQEIGIFAQWWSHNSAEISEIWRVVWAVIRTIAITYWTIVSTEIKIGLTALRIAWNIAWTVIRDTTEMTWNVIKAVVLTATHIVLDTISVVLALVTGHWSQAWSSLGKLASDALHGVISIIQAVASGFGNLLFDAGKAIIQGLINGIGSMAGAAFGAVKSVAGGLLHGAMSVLGISSPSKEFYKLGAYVTEGLANGITMTASKAQAAATQLAQQVTAAFSAGQITSSEEGQLLARIQTGLASRNASSAATAAAIESDKLGAQVTAMLGAGIKETMPQALDKARQLTSEINRVLRDGIISQAEADRLTIRIGEALTSRKDRLVSVMSKIGLKMGAGLLQGLENATSASTAKTAVNKLFTIVQQAWSAGDITLTTAGKLTRWLQGDNTRLQSLAAARASIAATVKAADSYAANVTSGTESWASLSNAATTAGGTSGADYGAGMSMQLAQIKQFSTDISLLAKRGLSKALLDQIIQAGPASGLPVAESLLDDTAGQIKSLNSTQAAISSYSTALGKTAADLMYDSGSQAGKGFLSGLQAQENAITKEMQKIALSMVNTIKKELKISSPSRVLMDTGADTAAGLVLGLKGGKDGVQTAAHGLAQAITAGVATSSGGTAFRVTTAGPGAGGGAVTITNHITVQGFIGNEQQLAQEIFQLIQRATLQNARRNPTNGLALLAR